MRHRGIGRVGLVAAVLAVGVAACARPAPAPPPPAVSASVASCGAPTSPPAGVIATLVSRTNSDRAANGLGALSWNSQLYCLAASGNSQRASTGTFAHQDLAAAIRGSYSNFRTLGENILRGPASMTGDQMEDAWMNSPSHRANILSGAYRYVAFATTIGIDGRIYATAIFGG